MFNAVDFLVKGGPLMVPLIGLSIASVACVLERSWFWFQLLTQEDQIVQDVLEAAKQDLDKAARTAHQAQHLPIGRFLLAPLKLRQPTPETFRLALETTGDKEFSQMRKGDRFLETAIGIAPLLGLLGTVTGLIYVFNNLSLGNVTGSEAGKLALGIAQALITTAAGMIIAIVSQAFFQIFQTFQTKQIDYFSSVGGELELIYRQFWYEPSLRVQTRLPSTKLQP